MPEIDELLVNNARYADSFSGALPLLPRKKLAVVACMDARLNIYAMLGLNEGDAHVIRNAGGVITHDAIRSLAISQRLLGTTEIVVIHHTECGMLTFTDDEFNTAIYNDVGLTPPWNAGAFTNLEAHLRNSLAGIRNSEFLPHTESVRGFIFNISTGRLREPFPVNNVDNE